MSKLQKILPIIYSKKLFALVIFLSQLSNSVVSFAQPEGGYLSGYDSTPHVQGISFWSTLAYILTLLLVFVFVLVLAYLAARFLSGKFSPNNLTGNGGKIIEHLPLGPNRSVCVVEIADKFFLLGVTDNSITLLAEITDEDEIEKLKSRKSSVPAEFFSNEMGSLFGMLKKMGNRH